MTKFQSKSHLFLVLPILAVGVAVVNLNGCAGGFESLPGDYPQGLPQPESQDPLKSDPSRIRSEEAQDDRSPFVSEEIVDRTYNSALAQIINNAAEIAVNSFKGAQTHPKFRAEPIQEVELLMRVKSEFIESIGRNGVLNQHNVLGSHGGGDLSTDNRLAAETRFLHIPENQLLSVEPTEFLPKYGFLNYKVSKGTAKKSSFEMASRYGDIIFALKPYVRHRTTYTGGDSLYLPENPRHNDFLTPLSDLTDLLNLHSFRKDPFGYTVSERKYFEFQVWGLLTLHQVQEIWIAKTLEASKMKAIDQLANQYGLKVYSISDALADGAPGIDHESFQANKTLIFDYSGKSVSSDPNAYLDLDELEAAYPTASTEWERAHIESAFAMIQGAKVPASLASQVQKRREIKNRGMLELEMAIPLTFVSASNHAKTFIDLIYSASSDRWLSRSDADTFARYLGSNPSVVREIRKLKSVGSFMFALERIAQDGVDLSSFEKLLNRYPKK